jgi:hypothetical protein
LPTRSSASCPRRDEPSAAGRDEGFSVEPSFAELEAMTGQKCRDYSNVPVSVKRGIYYLSLDSRTWRMDPGKFCRALFLRELHLIA